MTAPSFASPRFQVNTIPSDKTRFSHAPVHFLVSSHRRDGHACVPVLPGSLPEIIAVVSSAEMQELIDTEVKGLVSTSLFEPEPGKVVTVTHYTSMDTVAGSDKVSKAYAPVKHLFAGTPESLQGEVRWSRIS